MNRPFPLFLAAQAAVAALLLAACASNPYATSETPEQFALSTYEAGAALVHVATGMVNDPEIDASVRGQIKAAALALEEPLAKLKETALAVEQAKSEIPPGATDSEALRVALEALAHAQDAADAPLHNLTEALP